MRRRRQDRQVPTINDVCRICLAPNDHRSIDVAKSTLKMIEDVAVYFGVRINGRDGKCSLLCSGCQSRITAWNEMKKEVQRNEEMANDLLKRHETAPNDPSTKQ